MAIQSLAKFQSVFSTDPIAFDHDDFVLDCPKCVGKGTITDPTDEEKTETCPKCKGEKTRPAFNQEIRDALIEVGCDPIYIKPITSEQRADYEVSIVGPTGKQRNLHNMYAKYVAMCWVDDEGKLMGNAKQVGAMRTDFVAAMYRKCNEVNGGGEDALEEAGKG